MACSARQLVASTDGSHRNVKEGAEFGGQVRGEALGVVDAPTGLIDRDHGRVADLLAQLLVSRPRVAGRPMQQMHEASRRDLQAEAGLQQVGDLGQWQAAARVQVDDQRDHTGAELYAGRPQRVGGLQRVTALDTPPTLRAVADLDVEAPHHGAHRKVLLILCRPSTSIDRIAARFSTGSLFIVIMIQAASDYVNNYGF